MTNTNTTKQLAFKQHLIKTYPQDKSILLSYEEDELICLYSATYTKYLSVSK